MCGIIGILGQGPNARQDEARDMLSTLHHRGPDGTALADCGGCCLGLQRLAIIDLAAPATPFANEDGTVRSVCNGQIYNSAELRRELEGKGHVFATGVDTEVILHLWEEHGTDLVQRLNGMFAFAVWDGRRRALMLGRDRAGEKPLYYWTDGERLLFASEIRALLAHPAVSARLDPLALVRYLAHGYFPAPTSPLRGIRKLPAAHYLLATDGRVAVHRYWDLADWFPQPEAPDRRSADDIAAALDERLTAAVRSRCRSDVPLGVFLSGGLDSSAMLSYVVESNRRPVRTYSIGHADRAFDESEAAAETARFFATERRQLVLGESELEEGLRRVGEEMDEPLADASTIPTYLLARFASEEVTVVLSGEGADELFAGYPTYLGHRLAAGLRRLPRPVAGGLVGGVRRLLPVSMGNVGLDYLLQRFASGLDRELIERHQVWFGSVHPALLPRLLSPAVLEAVGEADVAAPFAAPFAHQQPGHGLPDRLARLLYTDFTQYLQDDLLTKVDRATMLSSLEARAPYLDHELIQFVAAIPSRWKLRRLTTKAILRRTVGRRLPPAVLRRRKRGFNIPFSRWILHGFERNLRERFSRERVAARGLLAHEGIERLLDEHTSGRADHGRPLFALLALDLWCDRTFGDRSPL